jgi:hypothetical protein
MRQNKYNHKSNSASGDGNIKVDASVRDDTKEVLNGKHKSELAAQGAAGEALEH